MCGRRDEARHADGHAERDHGGKGPVDDTNNVSEISLLIGAGTHHSILCWSSTIMLLGTRFW